MECHPKPERAARRSEKHLGALGAGNRFIEVRLDESGQVWVMPHSGSRGIDHAIGRYCIELAKRDMERWFIQIPDKDLAYFPQGAENFAAYVDTVRWARKYAWLNRKIVMENTLDALGRAVRPDAPHLARLPKGEGAVNRHHNYVVMEHCFRQNIWVTRKGATRARQGDMGVIPGSIGARSYIVRGKGNADSFHSRPHGTGHAMSRSEAKRRFKRSDHASQLEGGGYAPAFLVPSMFGSLRVKVPWTT